MMEVGIKGGLVALVDEADWPAVSQHRWFTLKAQRSLTVYARATVSGRTIYMHRLIMGEPKMGVIDHIDGNGLNNQRANLRLVTHRVNCRQAIARRHYEAWKMGELVDALVKHL